MGKIFYSLLFKQEAVAAHSSCHIFFLIAFLEEDFIINIITPCVSYKIIIRIYDNKTAVINKNLLTSSRFYIAIQISRGQRNHLFEIYRQFLHAPSKHFARPAVEYGVQDITSLNSQVQKLNLTVHTPCIIITSNKVHFFYCN